MDSQNVRKQSKQSAYHVFTVGDQPKRDAPGSPPIPTASETKEYKHRRFHTKSTLGCLTCKARRIKVCLLLYPNEVHPGVGLSSTPDQASSATRRNQRASGARRNRSHACTCKHMEAICRLITSSVSRTWPLLDGLCGPGNGHPFCWPHPLVRKDLFRWNSRAIST